MFIITIILVARYQPYKCKKSNTVDIVMLFVLSAMHLGEMFLTAGAVYAHWMNSILVALLSAIPPLYGLYLILTKVFHIFSRCMNRNNIMMKSVNRLRGVCDNETLVSDNVQEIGYQACQ